ncbi:MAG: hypothetical protein LBN05_01725 [Oscillospiraceae bacterium]|jgi:fructose-specific phosphotransferase system IIC component|nr:hypothetical protein [Oscillospiraceae bacterium]
MSQESLRTKLGAPVSLKSAVYRATAVMFVFQLFGALGAGFIFVVSNILQIHIEPSQFWYVFWHLCFWATDFAFVCFTLILAYHIAGIPAIAPALTLSLYYSHFAGLYDGADMTVPLYTTFFAPPVGGAGGLNIGYMGFLFIALGVGYGIRGLYTLWDYLKKVVAPWAQEKLIAKLTASGLAQKIKPIQTLQAKDLLDGIDLIVLILILPIVTALATYFAVQYIIAVPFNALGATLQPVLTDLFAAGKNGLGGLLMGLMVGFDTIGPLSMAGFRAAGEAAAGGNAIPITAFALSFAATGWVCMAVFILNKLTKWGGKLDTDDMNITVSGPINALFDNMKLTVAFGMPMAFRSPFTLIPGTIVACGLTAFLACQMGIRNTLYLTEPMVEKFLAGDYYTSFAQPHLKLAENNQPLATLGVIALGVIVGGAVALAIRQCIAVRQERNHTTEETSGDIVLEMRYLSENRGQNSEDRGQNEG